MSVDCGTRPGGEIVPRQPTAQAIQIREQHALVDVRLIELVADLPFELRRNHDAPAEILRPVQPVVDRRRSARHQREQRELIQNPAIDGTENVDNVDTTRIKGTVDLNTLPVVSAIASPTAGWRAP